MSIRKSQHSDLKEIYQLLLELNESLNEDQAITIQSIQRNYEEMELRPDIYENYVYEENGTIIGFVSLVHYKSLFHKNGTTLINELIVKKEQRSKGVGKILLEKAMSVSMNIGMDEIEVGVMKENSKAIEFYKKNGICNEYLILGKEFEEK